MSCYLLHLFFSGNFLFLLFNAVGAVCEDVTYYPIGRFHITRVYNPDFTFFRYSFLRRGPIWLLPTSSCYFFSPRIIDVLCSGIDIHLGYTSLRSPFMRTMLKSSISILPSYTDSSFKFYHNLQHQIPAL